MQGEISIKIDYDKFNSDAIWDGLKGYVTKTNLTNDQVIENYKNLRNIEPKLINRRLEKSNLLI